MKNFIMTLCSTLLILLAYASVSGFSANRLFEISPIGATINHQGHTLGGINTSETTVYICTGPQSKRFHKTSHCRGLNSCSGEIKAISISRAREKGRTPCKWCYN